jgi:LytS/YehU family sensor histidine kinase
MFNMLNYFQPWTFALLNASFELLTLMFMFYFTSLYLFPKYYKHNQKKYLLSSLAVVFLLSILIFSIDVFFLPDFKNPDHEKPPAIFILLRIFTTLGFSYFVSTSISLMGHAAKFQEKEKLLTEEKLQTELKLLKAQINPHFIFNALNNIYSLTFLKSENAPDSILKLSEMLRYVFYDCSKDKVQLSSEMKYVENFISFQQMKSEHEQNIQLNSEVDSLNFEIAPMLIIPFIENAFKYSRIEEIEEAYVQMSFIKEDEILKLYIENSVPEENKVGSGSGMGIKNVEHRLQILYPQNHKLEVTEENDKFIVSLEIKIQE